MKKYRKKKYLFVQEDSKTNKRERKNAQREERGRKKSSFGKNE